MLANGDVKENLPPEPFEHRHEKGRRRLPIDIEVAPNQNALVVTDRFFDAFDTAHEVVQGLRSGRGVRIRIQKPTHLRWVIEATTSQYLRHQGSARGGL